jgi:hypothetical protein
MKNPAIVSGNILFLHKCFKTGHSADLEIRQHLPKYRFDELAGIMDGPDSHALGRWKAWCRGPYHIADIQNVSVTKLTRVLAWLAQKEIKHRFTTTFST